MSTHSETQTCPNCGHEEFEYTYDNKTLEEGGYCLHCGYSENRKIVKQKSVMPLKELNDIREALGMHRYKAKPQWYFRKPRERSKNV